MNSLTGTQVDQYYIEKLIARGGMAEVYLATDVTLRRQVALKVMLSELAVDQTATARFRREAEAVARLNHPNIIQIYTTGMTPDNRSYLAMQYVSGGTLQRKLAELSRQGQQMGVDESLYLARQVAAALQIAHQQDIVHRDLKPSNIMLRSDGEPVITDLGIAAMETDASRLTQTGSVMGTPHYMSPEQALGQTVDGRADIYALGIILYEMLTGRVPFAADSPLAVLHQHIYEPPRSLASVRPGLSRSTYLTVETCLRKEPEKRFQTAEQLVAALNDSMTHEGLKTPRAVSAYPTLKIPDQRRRWPIWVVAAMAIFIVVVSVGYLLATTLADEQSDGGEGTQRAADINQTEALVQPSDTPTMLAPETIVPTITVLPTETVLADPGCLPSQEVIPYLGETGTVCLGGTRIFDLNADAIGCFDIGDIATSPGSTHFVIIVNCFEGDNLGFVFRADGSDKKQLTGNWDYINTDQFTWTKDNFFVYNRISSCCVEAPAGAPPAGVVWYNPQTDQKLMPDSPSPLVPHQVVNVASDDVLYLRAAAGAGNQLSGEIPHDGVGIQITGMGVFQDEDLWVPVSYQGIEGWVNSDFIGAEGSETVILPPQTTPHVTAFFLQTPPVIDGSLDEWRPDPTFLSSKLVYQDSSWDGSDDIEAEWQLGWDLSYLYLAATIRDDVHVQINSDTKIWQGDDVEIQFDADLAGDQGTMLNTDDFQLNVSPGDFSSVPPVHHLWRSGTDGRYDWIQDNGIRMGAQTLAGADYTLEIAVPWSELGINPSPGLRIGIALNVSDNDGPGTAVQEVLKSSSPSREFDDPSSWGTLTLAE